MGGKCSNGGGLGMVGEEQGQVGWRVMILEGYSGSGGGGKEGLRSREKKSPFLGCVERKEWKEFKII